ncbi:hypothetical protein BKA57DRAFT_492669 [Linnemannia elongata]|nr:hypothetical protein BKA57DRAFT_492669 [Linnemannia elongata]
MTLYLKPFRRCVTILARSMIGFMMLTLHFEFLRWASQTRWAVCTLPLFILPTVLGSYINLKEHGRWTTYYVIYMQLMTSLSEHYTLASVWDIFLFLSIDGTYRRHLQSLVGDNIIPLRVCLSSLISDDSKLSAFLAAHKILDPNNNNNDDKKYDGHDEKQQTATTTSTRMAKWVYAFVIGALVLNTYLVISVKKWNYDCSRMIAYDTLENDYEIDEYLSYCFPSPWRRAFRFPFLTWPHPENLVAIVTAFFCATAWSTLPTKIVIRAWICMWSNSNSDGSGDERRNKLFAIKKIHYFLFFYLLKMPAYGLINNASHERHLFLGALVFCSASSLVFALVLLWNLYVVHSGQDICQDQQQLLLQGDGFEYQKKVGGRGEAGGVSESEKTPSLDGESVVGF